MRVFCKSYVLSAIKMPCYENLQAANMIIVDEHARCMAAAGEDRVVVNLQTKCTGMLQCHLQTDEALTRHGVRMNLNLRCACMCYPRASCPVSEYKGYLNYTVALDLRKWNGPCRVPAAAWVLICSRGTLTDVNPCPG